MLLYFVVSLCFIALEKILFFCIFILFYFSIFYITLFFVQHLVNLVLKGAAEIKFIFIIMMIMIIITLLCLGWTK